MKMTVLLASLVLLTTTQSQANAGEGKELHAENCTRCHDGSMYKRPQPRVTDLPGLGKQVRFCKDNLGLTWFDDEVEYVVDYLNAEYYQF